MQSEIQLRAPSDPLPYHASIRDYLKREETAVWQWYASNRVREEHTAAVRLDLLKATYRIARSAQADLYAVADDVAGSLGLGELPLTIYQAQNPQGLNASLAYLPGEAHVVLHGPLLTTLSAAELRAVLGHELGHLLLYAGWQGELLVAEQVLAALTHDRAAEAPHFESARLFGLYTEVFCDRVALSVTGELRDVVSMLVKLATGVDHVDPQSYLGQAAEILQHASLKTAGDSHPEEFIRAHVLRLWQEKGDEANSQIAELIEGPPLLDELDLLAQQRVRRLTRRLIDQLVAPPWLQTDIVLAHARLFFADYAPPDSSRVDDAFMAQIARGNQALHDYYCYVMLDFATADRDLDEAPLAHAIGVAKSLGLQDRFAELAAKELRLRKKQLQQISADREQLIAAAARAAK